MYPPFWFSMLKYKIGYAHTTGRNSRSKTLGSLVLSPKVPSQKQIQSLFSWFSQHPPQQTVCPHTTLHRKKGLKSLCKKIKSSIIPTVHLDSSDPDYNDRPTSGASDAGSEKVLEAQAKVEFLFSLHVQFLNHGPVEVQNWVAKK